MCQQKSVTERLRLKLQRIAEQSNGPIDSPKELTAKPKVFTGDLLGDKLVRVQWKLVRQMQRTKEPKEVSALAMALKNVRETFHLVTGQAKPGVIRETTKRDKRQASSPMPMSDPTPESQ